MPGPGPDFNECAQRQLNCQDRMHKRVDVVIEKLNAQNEVLARIDERVAMLKVNTGGHPPVNGNPKWSWKEVGAAVALVATAIAAAIVAAVKVLA